MSPSELKDDAVELPEGYAAVPISANQKSVPLRVCVLARLQPDPVAGHLVVLRDTVDAQVLLGAVVDGGGRVHEWLELWVQSLEGLDNTLSAWREAISNSLLDGRWQRHFQAFSAGDLKVLVRTGWEMRHPLPVWIDIAKREPVHPVDAPSGEPWRLCQDDAVLAAAGLPPFSSSLHRYLYLQKLGAGSPFVPVTPAAPLTAATRTMEVVLDGRTDLIPFNPGGGLLLVRLHSPITLEGFIDLLTGAPAQQSYHGRSPLRLDGSAADVEADTQDQDGDGPGRAAEGWLFLGPHGRWGRLLESFHLKLRLLADAVEGVRSMVQHTQRPLLNLSPDRFQIRWAEPGRALPLYWTAKTVLVDPGDAVELAIQSTDSRYYLPGRVLGPSIYRPASASHAVEGACAIRIRKVIPELGGAILLEGTFTTDERLQAGKSDLVRLRVHPASGRLDLYAKLEAQAALARGEFRFRTLAQRLSPAAVAELQAAQGVPITNATFELLPLLSTPCDLYTLAVLAVRTLLVNPQTSLPESIDEVMSLARQVAHEHDATTQLRLRVRTVFERDQRWIQSLGPHRLAWEAVAPEQALDLVPSELWWDVLALIVRMLPGVGPDSFCSEYGDACPGGLHKVFDPVLDDLSTLLVRTRSLIVIDWRYNREIHSVIRGHLAGMADPQPAPQPPLPPPAAARRQVAPNSRPD